jgi:hypothetical protein
MDPNIGKATGKERTVAPCKESLPTSRGPLRNRFLEVQTEMRVRRASDKKILLADAAASTKRNLLLVGSCADAPVDLVAAGLCTNPTPPKSVHVDFKNECVENPPARTQQKM